MTDTVEDLWLFGSYARGDAAASSDVDILVVGDIAADETALEDYVRRRRIAGSLSYSHYTLCGISSLIRSGALFAWHLRLEGLPLASKRGWLAQALRGIAPYRAFRRDLGVLQVMVDESIASLKADPYTVSLEASILGVALRNAAMMISFIAGKPNFSTDAIFFLRSYDVADRIFDRLGDALISDLIAARLVSERGWVELHRWTKSELLVAANEISHWLGDLAKGTLNEGGYYATSISAPSPSGAPIGSNDQLSATA